MKDWMKSEWGRPAGLSRGQTAANRGPARVRWWALQSSRLAFGPQPREGVTAGRLSKPGRADSSTTRVRVRQVVGWAHLRPTAKRQGFREEGERPGGPKGTSNPRGTWEILQRWEYRQEKFSFPQRKRTERAYFLKQNPHPTPTSITKGALEAHLQPAGAGWSAQIQSQTAGNTRIQPREKQVHEPWNPLKCEK